MIWKILDGYHKLLNLGGGKCTQHVSVVHFQVIIVIFDYYHLCTHS